MAIDHERLESWKKLAAVVMVKPGQESDRDQTMREDVAIGLMRDAIRELVAEVERNRSMVADAHHMRIALEDAVRALAGAGARDKARQIAAGWGIEV